MWGDRINKIKLIPIFVLLVVVSVFAVTETLNVADENDNLAEETSNIVVNTDEVLNIAYLHNNSDLNLDKLLKQKNKSHLLSKIHKDFWNMNQNNSSYVLIELKNNNKSIQKRFSQNKIKKSDSDKLIFAELNAKDIQDIVEDENVKKIWPDLETTTFLHDSTFQISADFLWELNLSGDGIKIAILDSGINSSHEMLNNRVLIQEDFTGSGVQDIYGHGTHCAGIAGGFGYYQGVSYNVTIYNGKVIDDNGYGRLSWLIDGLDWAIEQEVDIISLSLGAIYSSSPEEQLLSPEVLKIEEAITKNISVVIASGNCASGRCGNFDSVTTPGIARNAITVGAVDKQNNWADFSSGDYISDYIKPDVVAPGVDICSAIPSGYDCFSGTSMATPHVAGAVALVLEHNNSLKPEQIKSLFEKSSIDLGENGKDIRYGSGLINLSALLNNKIPEEENKSYNIIYNGLYVGNKSKIILQYYNNDSSATRILVNFSIVDFDDLIVNEEEKAIPPNKIREFEISWYPKVTGKYRLNIDLFEIKGNSEYHIENIQQFIYVSGKKQNAIGPIEVVYR